MTKTKIVSYIKKDIKRLQQEQISVINSLNLTGNQRYLTLDYIVSRKATLKEILNLLQTNH